MKLENQVCTLEQGKRLLELGITAAPNYYRHVNQRFGPIYQNIGQHIWQIVGEHHFDVDVDLHNYMVPVFTAAELGVMLGDDCSYSFDENKVNAQFSKSEKPHWIAAFTTGAFNGKEQWLEFGDTMAEACARILILLIEKGKRNPEECNKRLAA